MAKAQPNTARPGRKSGEFTVSLPSGWELRLRRVVKQLYADTLPDPRAPGLTAVQREARLRARSKRMQVAMGRFVSDLLTADIVGREVALATRSRHGARRPSLREHVAAILREVADK